MKLLTQVQRKRLLENGRASKRGGLDPVPVVKLFTPDAQATWLLTEIDPDGPDAAFGLCDLGYGCPELAYVSLSELHQIRGRLGMPVERDYLFRGVKPVSASLREAVERGRLVA
jgi:hypothetical protein